MNPLSRFLILVIFVSSINAWSLKRKKPGPQLPSFCTKTPFLASCRPITPTWYYDFHEKRCKPLNAGICSGGNNKFATERKCKEICEPRSKQIPQICQKPPVMVQCGQVYHAWYYDPNSTSCKMFTYSASACNAIDNRFLTELKCQSVCIPIKKPKPICSHDPIPDRCLLQKKRWHFNFRNNTCVQFAQNRCGKGENSFSSYEKCMHRCSYYQYTAANQVSPTLPPGLPSQSGHPSRPEFSFPGQPPLTGGPVPSGQPAFPGRPGQGVPLVSPSPPPENGKPSTPRFNTEGQPSLPSVSGLPGQPTGPGYPIQPGLLMNNRPPYIAGPQAQRSAQNHAGRVG
ncbi:tissue factor pathway inhibitor 2-like [Dermacentor silvarum]|uniref:tissue factor pathway inhibitor 2-like n=1 Tax=Dermacentor silvarum TaxID=543639 RepID=UPI002101D348|nr:tissue factor pathway inhibitor 2-like [Dermacentor silvarum]